MSATRFLLLAATILCAFSCVAAENTLFGEFALATTQPPWVGLWQPAQATCAEKVFLMGGESNSKPVNDVYVLNGATWETKTAPFGARYGHAAAAVPSTNQIVLAGGQDDGDNPLSDVWLMDSCDAADPVWTLLTDAAPWTARFDHNMVYFKNQVVLFAGVTGNDVWMLDASAPITATTAWTQPTSANAQWDLRSFATAQVFNDQLYLIGGQDVKGNALNEVWVWSDLSQPWTKLADAPFTPRWGVMSAVVSSDIVTIGGTDASSNLFNTIYFFDGTTWTEEGTAAFSPRTYGALVNYQDQLMEFSGYPSAGTSSIGFNDAWVAGPYVPPADEYGNEEFSSSSSSSSSGAGQYGDDSSSTGAFDDTSSTADVIVDGSTAADASSTAPAVDSSSTAPAVDSSSAAPADGSSTGVPAPISSTNVPAIVLSSTGSPAVVVSSTASAPSTPSSTAGTPSVESSTGAAVPIPAYLPTLAFVVAANSSSFPGGSTKAFRDLLLEDLAPVAGVTSTRILVNSISDVLGTGRAIVVFTITPRLAEIDLTATAAASKFLAALDDPTNAFFTTPVGVLVAAGSGHVSTDSTGESSLKQGAFKLSYDLNSLPGGGTIKGFFSLVVVDLAKSLGIDASRIYPLDVTAGSVVVTFTIAPPADATETSVDSVLTTFVAQVNDPNSQLYKGAVTSQAIVGSGTSGTAGTTPYELTDNGSSSKYSDLEKGLIVIVVLLAAAIVAFGIWFVVKYKKGAAASNSDYRSANTDRPAETQGHGRSSSHSIPVNERHVDADGAIPVPVEAASVPRVTSDNQVIVVLHE